MTQKYGGRTVGAVAGVVLAVVLCAVSLRVSAVPILTMKPIVGAVTATQATIHARTDSSATVAVKYGTSPTLAGAAVTAPVTTVSTQDFIGHLALTGLSAETLYHYAVLLNGVQGSVFNFRTFPPPGQARTFTFAVFADQGTAGGGFTPVLTDAPVLTVQLGDYNHNDPGSNTNNTIAAWWTNHRSALTGSFFANNYPSTVSVPFVHTWDDHDYGSNNGSKTAWYRAIALQAFRDSFPVYPLPNPAGIWQSFRYGQAEFFVLDLRSQRDFSGDPDGPQKSMLDGDLIANDQKTWLKNGLLTSTARWKFVITSVPFTLGSTKGEGWYGYQTERAEIANYITANGIAGVIFLSGDIHSGGGIEGGAFPEVAVPNTNLGPLAGCTGPPDCGTWSEGILNPSESRGGYVAVTVDMNDRVDFRIKDFYGRLLQHASINTANILVSEPVDPLVYTMDVLNPTATVTWAVGSPYQTQWAHDLLPASPVRLELSRDGGSAWETVIASTPSAADKGVYSWTVTGPPTTQARVKVTALDSSATDTSPAFTIAAPTLAVTFPNTAATFPIGSAKKLTWNTNMGGNTFVRVELSRTNGSTWDVLAASVKNGQNAGSYTWVVTGPATTQALVRVTALHNGVGDVSNAPFTIQ